MSTEAKQKYDDLKEQREMDHVMLDSAAVRKDEDPRLEAHFNVPEIHPTKVHQAALLPLTLQKQILTKQDSS